MLADLRQPYMVDEIRCFLWPALYTSALTNPFHFTLELERGIRTSPNRQEPLDHHNSCSRNCGTGTFDTIAPLCVVNAFLGTISRTIQWNGYIDGQPHNSCSNRS